VLERQIYFAHDEKLYQEGSSCGFGFAPCRKPRLYPLITVASRVPRLLLPRIDFPQSRAVRQSSQSLWLKEWCSTALVTKRAERLFVDRQRWSLDIINVLDITFWTKPEYIRNAVSMLKDRRRLN